MTAIAHHPHRVAAAVADVRGSLASVAEVPVWSMDATETTTVISEIQAARAQLAELEARMLRQAEAVDVPAKTGATSVPNWYAHHTKSTRRQAHRTWRLAQTLDAHDATRSALAEGRVQVEQAEEILRAVDQLPDGLDADQVQQVEEHLLELATDFDAKHLRTLGRRAVEVIDPDAADAHEARLLEREERAAEAATTLTIWDDGHGRTHGRFTVDTLTGAALRKALLAIAAPKHQAASGPLGERRPTPERLGQAFVEYVQRYPADRLPKAGGLNATVVVLMSLETLMGGLKVAHLDTGETISPGAARRLACEAGIIPAVLDGRSQVLDLGRKQRFHNEAQRIAATIEQQSCSAEGCDWPPGLCHMHHPVPWSRGGKTDRDGMLLCPRHHAIAHDQRYTTAKVPGGQITFHRRT